MILYGFILKELFKFHALLACFFSSIYIFMDFLEKNTRYFPSHHVSAQLIFEYYFFQIPRIYLHVLPFTVLLALLILLWILRRTGQLMALKSFGLSPANLSSLLIVFSLLMVTIHFFMAEFLLPPSQNYFKEIEAYKIENSPLEKMFFENHWLRGKSGIMYYKNINRSLGLLYDVEYFSQSGKNMSIIHGSTALFDEQIKAWVISNAKIHSFKQDNSFTQKILPRFITPVYYQPTLMLQEHISSDQIDIFTLWETIKKSRESGQNVFSRELDFYQKIVQPLLSLVYMLFTLPFLLLKERQTDNYIQIVICFAFIMAYNILAAFLKNLSNMGVMYPALAVWTPLLVLVFLSLPQIIKIRKESA